MVRLSLFVVLMVPPTAGVLAQVATPTDVAAKLSGTWKLNLALSPSVSAPGRSGGRGPSGAGRGSFAVGLALSQRGGRGGGGGSEGGSGEASAPVPAEEIAALRILQGFQQIPTDLSIVATADTVTLKEDSGQGTFAVNGKTIDLSVDGATIKTKTKWDRETLKQEFWSVRRKVTRVWSLDPSGHLILTMRVETMMKIPDVRAVFDRQPLR
jgi:hypothetical protein